MTTVPHDDPRLSYVGRWVNFGTSHGCAWQAGQVRFKVSEASELTINANVSGQTYCVVNIDSGPPKLASFPGLSGQQVVSFPMSDSGEHTVVVKLFGLPDDQFAQALYCRLMSITLDTGATLSAWTSGNVSVQFVGDSWMSAQNDWPYLLPPSRYSVYPVAFGGATAASLDSRYDYVYSGMVAPADPVVEGVVVNAGVNDTWGGVSTASYKSSMESLVDKIRARQPTAKIIILGSPRNLAGVKPYNQYDAVNSEIAAAKTGVTFIPVPNSLADSLSWNGDAAHINYTGGLVPYAEWVDAQIYPILMPRNDYALWMRTPTGMSRIQATQIDPQDAFGVVALRVSSGYLGLSFEPVVGDPPKGVLLFRTPDGLLQAT